jgi:uncharacterized glyoxalase superfamily protein PhnB
MSLTVHHLYRETADWNDRVIFWRRLEFSFGQQWGSAVHRAETLTNGAPRIMLTEDARASEPSQTAFFVGASLDALAHDIDRPITDTHWGTRMVSVTDPDGRTYNFEPRSDHP